jgi:AraC-like DNA-binding protein
MIRTMLETGVNARKAAMLYRSYTPAPPLSEFIDRFWLCHDMSPNLKERILPSGTIELVINLREDEVRIYDPLRPERCKRFSGAVVSGTYSGCFVIDPAQHASILGVHFKPGGAFPFLGPPAGELADTHVDLETLWGPRAVELRERLCSATTPIARFRLLEQALVARPFRPLEHHGAVPVALAAFGRTDVLPRVQEIVRSVGLSPRRFIEVFTAEVGLTPKLYGRIQRFQRVRALARQDLALDWAQLAVDCGYFDQSHLISDFRALSGLTPTEYLRQRSETVLSNHVPLAR